MTRYKPGEEVYIINKNSHYPQQVVIDKYVHPDMYYVDYNEFPVHESNIYNNIETAMYEIDTLLAK